MGGPTLAGLSGGIAGELQRLFPIKSNFEYPLRRLKPVQEKNSYQIQPYDSSSCLDDLQDNFLGLFCDSLSIDFKEIPKYAIDYIKAFKMEAILSQDHFAGLGIECDDLLYGYLLGTKDVKSTLRYLEEAFTKAKRAKNNVPLSLPLNTESVPWKTLEKFNSILSLMCVPEMLFTKTLKNVFKLMFMITGTKSAAIIVDRCMPITKQFLLELKFQEIYKTQSLVVLAHDETVNDEEGVEKMDEN